MGLFKLGEKPVGTRSVLLGVLGGVFLLVFWWGLAEAFSRQKPIVAYETQLENEGVGVNRDSLARVDSLNFAHATKFEKIYPLLPPPDRVIGSLGALVTKDDLFGNMLYSLGLNIKGYFWAISLALLLGFPIGLFPLFRGMFRRSVDALRYLPLSALTGLFILWFGLYDHMKIAFLAFGILVYLLPVVVQRIDEVEDVYKTAVYTLGATNWQMIRTVYIPSVLGKIMDDIRVLTAISWTYIIIAELQNRTFGLGSLIYLKFKSGQIDKAFAILLVIIVIGFLQDRIFAYIDRRLNPHKYFKREPEGVLETRYGIYTLLGLVLIVILQEVFFPQFSGGMMNLVWIGSIAAVAIIGFGEWKIMDK